MATADQHGFRSCALKESYNIILEYALGLLTAPGGAELPPIMLPLIKLLRRSIAILFQELVVRSLCTALNACLLFFKRCTS